MPTANPYEKLQLNSIYTATKEEMTLMLYEGALKFCNQAIIALENGVYDKCNDLIIRVENIITELQLTLNFDHSVSKYFAGMYDYMKSRLVEANMKKSMDALVETRGLLREFRDMWKEAMKSARMSR